MSCNLEPVKDIMIKMTSLEATGLPFYLVIKVKYAGLYPRAAKPRKTFAFLILITCLIPLGMLCPGWGPPDQFNWSKFSRVPPRWSGAGALLVWGEVEGPGLLQPREEVASMRNT